jgi:transposase-like protein
MSQRKQYSSEFKVEAIELVRSSSCSASQVARDIGLNPAILNRWCREAKGPPGQAFRGSGTPRDQEMARLKRELARVKKDVIFCATRQRTSPGNRREVRDDPALSPRLSCPVDVSLPPGFDEWLLCLGPAIARYASP